MATLHPNNITGYFNIPIYQRLFTWNDEQIEQLLTDLLLKCIESEGKDNLYIGVLTVTRNQNRLDLVDGQQRFTVMVLMGIVLKHYYLYWSSFIENKKESGVRLNFSARPNDCNYLRHLITNEEIGDLRSFIDEHNCDGYVNIPMKIGLLKIYDFVNNIGERTKQLNIESDVDAEKFSKYVYEHLSFFIDELPSDYSTRQMNKHFETMNSTGRNLENHEILKVELLKDESEYEKFAGAWNQVSVMNRTLFPLTKDNKDYYAEIVGDLSTAFEKIVQTESEDAGITIKDVLENPEKGFNSKKVSCGVPVQENRYYSFLTFSDFLLHVLYCLLDEKQKKDIIIQKFFDPNKMLATFERYVGKKDSQIKPADFIKQLVQYRVLYDYYIIRIDGEGDYDLLATQTQERSNIEQYEAMLFSGTSRYTYYQWIPFILAKVKNGEQDFAKLLLSLKENDAKYHEFDINKLTYRTIDNYFFRRLDYELWENRDNKDIVFKQEQEKAVGSYRFHQYNSVEHFYPQDNSEQVNAVSNVDSFGNLALVSDSFNSIQSNDYLGVKVARIKEQIVKNKIESLKLVLMYNAYEADKTKQDWMEAHEKQMICFLEKKLLNTKDSSPSTPSPPSKLRRK